MEEALKKQVEREKLVYHPGWVNKVIQLYETTLVRHGEQQHGPSHHAIPAESSRA